MASNSSAQNESAVKDIRADNISIEDIREVAKLSRLAIDEQTAQHFANDIDKILNMMQTIANVDTSSLMPLANVHEAAQELRSDIPNPDINRELNQSIAPAVEQGLYLVPQVIE